MNMLTDYDKIIQENVPELETIGDMNFRIASQGAYLRAHLLGTESAKDNLQNAQQLLQQSIDALRTANQSSNFKALLNNLQVQKKNSIN